MFKKIMFFFLFILTVFCTWNCNSILYGLEQGYHQLRIVSKAVPIEDVLDDDSFPDSLKQKLRLVQEIRKFAVDSLGINDTKNYHTFYDQKGKPILWVVIASPPYKLAEYEWDFPFVGNFPYKGYFKKSKAEEEAKQLDDEGFDISVNEVRAWSTLGILKDPILSEMLYRSEGSLARLIIHELTHATLFVKNNGTFNENLATFVGDRGAILFLKYKYGGEAEQLTSYLNEINDLKIFSEHMLRGSIRLDSLYEMLGNEVFADNIKRQKKESLISEILADADTIMFSNRLKYSEIRSDTIKLNNTFFTQFRVYRINQDDLEKEFEEEFQENFFKYLTYLKEKYGK